MGCRKPLASIDAFQANPKHSTKALIINFSIFTSLLEQEA